MARWLILGLALMRLCLATPLYAQDDTTFRTYTLETPHGNISIDYPAEWYINDQSFGVDFVDFRNRPLPPDLPTGLVEMVVLSPQDLDFTPTTDNLATDNLAFDYFIQFRVRQLLDGIGVYGDPIAVYFGDEGQFAGVIMAFIEHQNVQSRMDAERVISLGMAATLSDDALLIINFQSEQAATDEFIPIWQQMIASLRVDQTLLWNDAAALALANLDTATALDRQFQATYETSEFGVDESRRYVILSEIAEVAFAPPNGWMRADFSDADRALLISPNYPNSTISYWLTDTPPTYTTNILDSVAFDWDGFPSEITLFRNEVAYMILVSVQIDTEFLLIQASGLATEGTNMSKVINAAGRGLQINGEPLTYASFSTAMIDMRISTP